MILETKIVEGRQCDFTIDLNKDTEGLLTIDVAQSGDQEALRLVSIEVDDLSALIGELQYFYEIMNIVKPTGVKHVNNSIGQKIVDYYFKNVQTKDIALLLGVRERMVKSVLAKRGISQSEDYRKKKSWYYKRKK